MNKLSSFTVEVSVSSKYQPQDVSCGIKIMKHPARVGDMKVESNHLR